MNLLADMVEQKGTQAAVAKELGISTQEVSKTISGSQSPPRKVLSHFELETKTIYVRKGKK